jgi:alpha-ketoglutarate-dependent taurine dioxygenase
MTMPLCLFSPDRTSPPDQPIPFHHELAQTPNPPRYIFFYCDQPPESGGQTPIIDSTAVYRFAKVRTDRQFSDAAPR